MFYFFPIIRKWDSFHTNTSTSIYHEELQRLPTSSSMFTNTLSILFCVQVYMVFCVLENVTRMGYFWGVNGIRGQTNYPS